MKESIYSKLFVRITAFICIVAGLVVMYGWVMHIPGLVQSTAESVPVHFNTALTFFLIGIAFLCLTYNRFYPLIFFLGLLIALMGAITLSQDLFSFNSGIDQFFINDYIQVLTTSPGRMSPNTSAPFLLAGILIAVFAVRPKTQVILISTKLIAIVVFCIGLTPLFGYILNIETAYTWGHSTPMSLLSAILFSLSGIALLCLAFKLAIEAKVHTSQSYPYLAGLLFFFLSILLSIAIGSSHTSLQKATNIILGIGIVLAISLGLYVQAFFKIKQHLSEVEKSEERFRFVAKATNDILWDWNIPNDQFLISDNIKLLGYAPHAVQYSRKWWFECVHPDDKQKLSDSLKNCLSSHLPFWSYEYRFIRSDGTYAAILDRAYMLYTENNEPLRAIGAMVDITERKNVEQRKNEFISVVSHELRTPLTSIKGSLGLLLANTGGTLPEKATQLLTISVNNCDRLVRLISNILDIEKIESNRVEFVSTPLNIIEVVKESIQTNDTYAKTGIQMVFNSELTEAFVFASHDRLRQVMDNLLSNAIKFSPEDATITISVERVKSNLRVSVSDEGEGIPLEFRKRIFEKFARADSSTARVQGGTGLGLSISRAIIERFGGTIGFLPRVPKGTTFFFELPELEKGESGLRHLPLTANRALQILILEDDKDFAEVLKLLLEKEGATVDNAFSVAHARELLRTKMYDLLTLDIALPDQDGISFVQELREQEKTKTLPILVISSTGAEMGEMLQKRPYSVITCLEKPFSLDDLKTIIAKVPKASDSAKGPLRILHVEDEKDVLDVVKVLLEKDAVVEQAMTVREAKKKLQEANFDLVLLDIRLPDGSGLSLLPIKDYQTKKEIPTIIFSASETPKEYMHFVTVSLLKSQVSIDKVLQTVRNILKQGASQ